MYVLNFKQFKNKIKKRENLISFHRPLLYLILILIKLNLINFSAKFAREIYRKNFEYLT